MNTNQSEMDLSDSNTQENVNSSDSSSLECSSNITPNKLILRCDSPLVVQKTALLGKEKAKKRLQAFSLLKHNMLPLSPLLKKKNATSIGQEGIEGKIEKSEEKKKKKKGRFYLYRCLKC